jgi:ketosteroid isomerase-like protein
MTITKATQVAAECYAAWTGGDVNQACEYLTDDIEIVAPNGTFTGHKGYHDFMDGFVEMLTGASELTTFGNETTALLWYDTHLTVVPTLTAAERITLSPDFRSS